MANNNATSTPQPEASTSRYRLPDNPMPLEPDSDPDFNPGVYVAPKKPKGRRGKKASASTGRTKGKQRLVTPVEESDEEEYQPTRAKRKLASSRSKQNNPLMEYFADLGLQSASEGENEDLGEVADNEEDLEEDELRSSDVEEEDEEPPVMPRTLAVLAAEKSRTQSRENSQQTSAAQPDDDSVTEPETDEETRAQQAANPLPPSQDLKRKSPETSAAPPPPSKKAKIDHVPAPEDDSVTEPESVAEPESETEPESVTEPESEVVEDDAEELKMRPAFMRKADQPILGPMVLDAEHKVPGSINTFLRDYQRDGVRFFWERYQEGRGGLLGDDMGLGKTIQVISFLSAIMGKTGDSRDIDRRRKHVSRLQDGVEWKQKRRLPKASATWPTALIIAPSSVVPNWEREFETWGFFEVGVYSNSGADRQQVLKDFKMGRLDVVITSFDLARRDIDLLDTLAWSVIIVDEVHRVKNPRAKLTVAFSQFECQARFGLTGTAIQNDYSELWTILDWTSPGALGTHKQWEGFVSRPLTRGQSKSATEEERVMARQVARILRDKLLPKFFLRRTKALIKDQLPNKFDQVVFCPLTPVQLAAYKRVLQTKAVQNLIKKDEPCDCGSKATRKACCHPYDKTVLFRYMSTLLKIANHLCLVLPAPGDTAEQNARNRELSEEIFAGQEVPKYGPTMLESRFCGKWLVLQTLLRTWRKDDTNKILIFTKSVKLLHMLEFQLQSENIGFVKLDGSTKQSDRMPMIDKFHEDPNVTVFLISTLAGGTGLNLTGANKVVIFDPNWNPAHDLQAMDRAYRFGQTRDVEIYRLLGAGCAEELIYARQVYKQQQMAVGYNASLQTRYFEGVQGDKTKQGELFGIKNIFMLHEDTLATKQAIERAHILDLDWALANMDAKASQARKSDEARWVYEAEAKAKKEYGDLHGLGALLFDDDAPELEREHGIPKELSNIGVNYIHRNEDLITENAVEAQRLEVIIQGKKKARRQAKTKKAAVSADKSASPEPQWPPKRKHHKPPPGPQEKLMSRREAMIELGMISSPAQLSIFAQEFSRKSVQEQAEILARLDRHARESMK